MQQTKSATQQSAAARCGDAETDSARWSNFRSGWIERVSNSGSTPLLLARAPFFAPFGIAQPCSEAEFICVAAPRTRCISSEINKQPTKEQLYVNANTENARAEKRGK